MLLERTLSALHPRVRVAALVGDLATENDAARLARSGALVRQIVTGTVCHLEAEMVRRALEGWDLGELNYLFVENAVASADGRTIALTDGHSVLLKDARSGKTLCRFNDVDAESRSLTLSPDRKMLGIIPVALGIYLVTRPTAVPASRA